MGSAKGWRVGALLVGLSGCRADSVWQLTGLDPLSSSQVVQPGGLPMDVTAALADLAVAAPEQLGLRRRALAGEVRFVGRHPNARATLVLETASIDYIEQDEVIVGQERLQQVFRVERAPGTVLLQTPRDDAAEAGRVLGQDVWFDGGGLQGSAEYHWSLAPMACVPEPERVWRCSASPYHDLLFLEVVP